MNPRRADKAAGTGPAAAALSPAAELRESARRASRRAASISNGNPRGAALRCSHGVIFAGSQISADAGPGLETCAERAAVYQAVLAGRKRFLDLVIRGGRRGRGDGGPPCGACLQVLVEFSPRVRVWWGTDAQPRGGEEARHLLPGAFRFSRRG